MPLSCSLPYVFSCVFLAQFLLSSPAFLEVISSCQLMPFSCTFSPVNSYLFLVNILLSTHALTCPNPPFISCHHLAHFLLFSSATASCHLRHLALSPIFCSFSSHPYVISRLFLVYLILSSHVFSCSHSSSLSYHFFQSFHLSPLLTYSCHLKLTFLSCSLSAITSCVFLFTSFFHFMCFSCSHLLLYHE
jgi:hypothetical protein